MTDPATRNGADGPVVRRVNTATRARFKPRTQPDSERTSADSIVGAPAPKAHRLTDRRREVAGDLPEWDLLPPGEITVRRK